MTFNTEFIVNNGIRLFEQGSTITKSIVHTGARLTEEVSDYLTSVVPVAGALGTLVLLIDSIAYKHMPWSKMNECATAASLFANLLYINENNCGFKGNSHSSPQENTLIQAAAHQAFWAMLLPLGTFAATLACRKIKLLTSEFNGTAAKVKATS